MATYSKSVYGTLKGKFAETVSLVYRTKRVVKSAPQKKSNAAVSDDQQTQRLKFKIATAFLYKIPNTIQLGYQKHRKLVTPMNAAVSYTLYHAILETAAGYEIDLTKIRIADGDPRMEAPSNATIHPQPGNTLALHWTYIRFRGPDKTNPTDLLLLLCYCPTKNKFLEFPAVATRKQETIEVQLPPLFAHTALHCWLFFSDTNGRTVSSSVYQGLITLLS